MTEPTNHAGLLARLRYQPGAPEHMWAIDVAELLGIAANVIEADAGDLQAVQEWSDYIEAELRQERERADTEHRRAESYLADPDFDQEHARVVAELRQEREKRRPIALSELMQAQADLARAREVIDHIDTALRGDGRSAMVVVVAQGIINEYRDKQTGSGGWEPCAAMCGTEPCSPACERPTSERCAPMSQYSAPKPGLASKYRQTTVHEIGSHNA